MKKSPHPYLKVLKKRAAESRVYRKHQLAGLEIAELLQDDEHKALYIKLAKSHGAEALLALAKEVKERKGIRNKGAYFMSCLVGKSMMPFKKSRKQKKINRKKSRRSP